jgi:hypothetical protein
VAGCQSRPGQPATTMPTRAEQAVVVTTVPAKQMTPPRRPPAGTTPRPAPVPRPDTIVGLWPARTLGQARMIQDGADHGHQPWLLSPELVSTSYAAAELGLYEPVARRVGRNAWQVGARNSEWAATLYLDQPVRRGADGVWVVARVGS